MEAPKWVPRAKRIAGILGVPSRSHVGEGPCRHPCAGTYGCRTPRGRRGRHVRTERSSESPEPLASCRSAPATVKAFHISRSAMKLGCAREWGGWGRISVDGPGQHNLDRSEDPWSRATYVAEWWCSTEQVSPTQCGGLMLLRRARRMEANLYQATGMMGAILTAARSRKALSDKPALEPYRGKTRSPASQGGRWKRRHHSKPDTRHRPTRQ